jgi:S1-C subfamily serine protease
MLSEKQQAAHKKHPLAGIAPRGSTVRFNVIITLVSMRNSSASANRLSSSTIFTVGFTGGSSVGSMLGRFVLAGLGIASLGTALPACRGSANPSPDRFVPAVTAQSQSQSQAQGPAVPASARMADPGPVVPLSPGAKVEDEKNTISVFREMAASTVFVTQTQVVTDFWGNTSEEVPSGSGSGFVWDTDGHIVTNFHVVQGARSLTVTFRDQKTYPAKVVGVEPKKDVAVLKVETPKELLKPVNVPKKLELEVGQKTIAIGNPFGLDHTLTTGVVSALGRQVKGIGNVTIRDMIQTDAAINPGNSGGPLLDSSGQLIGMNTMIFSRSGSSAGIGFAVPSSTIARVANQIIKTGRAEQLGLGINADAAGRPERQFGVKGVVVLAVPETSPAAKAGLLGVKRTQRGYVLGDVITKIGETKVDNYDDFYNALDQAHAGDKVNVVVMRGDAFVTLVLEVLVVNRTDP